MIPPDFNVDLRLASPSACYHQMASGKVDAALVPVAALNILGGPTEILGSYGIACEGAVHSVRLFSRKRLADIVAGEEPIHGSAQSLSSRALLGCLCNLEFSKQPVWCDDPDAAAGRLLIGEEALDTRREEHGWPGMRDLGQWWHERTGLPFVFARWVVRRDLEDRKKALLLAWLEENVRLAQSTEGRESLAAEAVRDGLCTPSIEFARRYYTRVHPRLGLRDLQGLEHFLTLEKERKPWTQSA